MPVAVDLHPIAPDRLDEWRRLVEDLTGPPSAVLVEAADPDRADELLRSSAHEFDVCLCRRLGALLEPAIGSHVLFDTAPRRGPWRGLARRGARP